MNHYELLFVLPGTLAENEVSPEVEKVRALIESNGGTNLEMGESDKRRLAYPIKQIRYGYFQLAYFQAEPADVKTMEGKLRIMPELLRAIIYRYNPSEKKAKKINFGTLAIGEEGKRPEIVVEEVAPVMVETAEVAEVAVQSEEKQKLEAAPVKKASAKKEEKKKVNLDEIDKKLDEILDMGLDNV